MVPTPAAPHLTARTPPRPTHAVVVGAGLAGLTAARALSRHAERVTLVERSDLPGPLPKRSAMPPSRRVDVLQPDGLTALERLLPGFGDQLVAHGAVRLTAPRDVSWMSAGRHLHPFAGPARTVLSATRDLVAWVTHRLVADTPQVIVRSGLEAVGLVVTPPSVAHTVGQVRAVDVRPRGSVTAAPTESIVADLVVDASGHRSRTPDWLAAAGYDRPAETPGGVDLVYASRLYDRRTTGDDDCRALFVLARPPRTWHGAALVPIECDRWMLTMAGRDDDPPPGDEDGLLAFLQSLPTTALAEAVAGLEPLSPVVRERRMGNPWRRYESLRMPDGFLVVGDAAGAVAPTDDQVYDQGTSLAAHTAAALDRCLCDHLAHTGDVAGVSARAQRALVHARAGTWRTASGGNLRDPATLGDAPRAAGRWARGYLDDTTTEAEREQQRWAPTSRRRRPASPR